MVSFLYLILLRLLSFAFIYFEFNKFYFYANTDDSQRVVLCSASCPVWICEHAINLDHPCTFLFCDDCRTKEMMETNHGNRPKRKPHDIHKSKKKSKLSFVEYDDDDDDESDLCNHEMTSLKKLEDGKYFTEEYVKEKDDNPEYSYASICHKCGGHVRDRVPA